MGTLVVKVLKVFVEGTPRHPTLAGCSGIVPSSHLVELLVILDLLVLVDMLECKGLSLRFFIVVLMNLFLRALV